MKKELTNNFILLLLLYADNKNSIIGRTRLQKIVFLYEKECQNKINKNEEKNLFDFYSYDYGPFSKKLLKHVEILLKFNFIKINNPINPTDFYSDNIDKNTEYTITPEGIECVEEDILKENLINYIDLETINSFKKKYNYTDLNDLIEFVYTTYPEYTNKSKIKEKVLGV